MLVNVDYHINDRCNLNCAHCNHFCPLVPKDVKDKSIEQITADLALLSKFKDHVQTLGLLGGEPMLHPKLSKICYIARKFFPTSEISITSNGTLANKVLEFKDAIEENNIQLVITIYPYKENPYEDYEKIKKIIPSTVAWEFPTTNGMTYNLLSSRVDITSKEEIFNCVKRWRCNQLKDGKLYICHYAAYIDYLTNAFPEEVNIKKDDQMYLDLNDETLTIDGIYKFQQTTYPSICDHCADAHYGGYAGPVEPWRKTEHKLEEWYQK